MPYFHSCPILQQPRYNWGTAIMTHSGTILEKDEIYHGDFLSGLHPHFTVAICKYTHVHLSINVCIIIIHAHIRRIWRLEKYGWAILTLKKYGDLVRSILLRKRQYYILLGKENSGIIITTTIAQTSPYTYGLRTTQRWDLISPWHLWNGIAVCSASPTHKTNVGLVAVVMGEVVNKMLVTSLIWQGSWSCCATDCIDSN